MKTAMTFAAAVLFTCSAANARAQLSLTSAVDLALRNNIKVKLAEDDVRKAKAGLDEARSAYIPNLNGSSGAPGYAYGFPLGTPTLYGITSSSIVYSAAQGEYVRSSRAGLLAATLALTEAREQAVEEVTTTYLDLNYEQQKLTALNEQLGFADRLRDIIKDRLDAGQDTPMEYTSARRTQVRIQLQQLVLTDQIASDEDHLARLIGLGGTRVQTLPDGFPEQTLSAAAQRAGSDASSYDSPGVRSALVSAQSKHEQAAGDQKYTFYPVVTFNAAYSKFATFNNSYVKYYPSVQGYVDPATGQYVSLTSEAFGFGFNIGLPLFDRTHKARANASLAEAIKADHEADRARSTALEGRLKLNHGLAELRLRTELAGLDRDYAQQQLNVILIQMQTSPAGAGPVMTPKDEQNARINERQLFLDMLDQQHLLDQTEVSLLRQTGSLEAWLRASVSKP